MSRPTMRFVLVKSAGQQAALMLVGMRERAVAARTQLASSIRGYASEFGLTVSKVASHIPGLIAILELGEEMTCEPGLGAVYRVLLQQVTGDPLQTVPETGVAALSACYTTHEKVCPYQRQEGSCGFW